MAGARHFHRDIDHRGDHLASKRRRQPLRIVDAILQGEDGRLALQMRRQRLAGRFGVGGLHRKEHEARAARAVGSGARIEFDEFIKLIGLQAQAGAPDCFDMLRPGDQGDLVSGAGKHGAVVAADSARAHYCDGGFSFSFQAHPFRTSLPIMVPDSSRSCAFLRLAPLMGESVSLSVHFNLPASSRSATSFSRRCCSIMSLVWKRARVNMSSQHSVALFERTTSIDMGFWLPTIATMAPWGAMRSAIAAQ